MKIRNIEISNFKAIKHVKLDGLEDTVVIAGPNGCGKSCIFDAIRLLKSLYGGHNQNEWHQWFGEFQINLRTLKDDVKRILNDKSKPLRIAIGFEFNEDEKKYFKENASSLIENIIWNSVLPEESRSMGGGAVPAAEVRHHRPTVEQRRDEFLKRFMTGIDNDLFWGEVNVTPDGKIEVVSRPILELCFTVYDPKNIGLIDYHSANRSYSREQVGGINLNIESSEQKMKNHALYNSANKYNNVKSEMAGAYIRELLAKEANVQLNERENIISTLKELFKVFFPGKSFLGPVPTPDGNLHFPVRLDDGSKHDINDLSSGEKEVLYGYLRLQNTSPRNSILLLDEPELHLNPRLIRGLPKFYQKYIGEQNNNQIWLVTHSDAFLRETVGEPGFSVFHMRSATSIKNGDQVEKISADDELEAAFIDLVGDLAAYSPAKNVIIFEGGGDSDFDLKLVNTLFPELIEMANLISGENKVKVRALHDILDKANSNQMQPYKFYSVVDKDAEEHFSQNSKSFHWDVYHIENYLLNNKYIARVMNELVMSEGEISEESVEETLVECAKESMGPLIAHKLTKTINEKLLSCFNLKVNPRSESLAEDISCAASKSSEKIKALLEKDLSGSSINQLESDTRSQLHKELESGEWRKSFKGRDILKLFISKKGNGVKYEIFRNLIIHRMRDDGYKPAGMNAIISQIVADMA